MALFPAWETCTEGHPPAGPSNCLSSPTCPSLLVLRVPVRPPALGHTSPFFLFKSRLRVLHLDFREETLIHSPSSWGKKNSFSLIILGISAWRAGCSLAFQLRAIWFLLHEQGCLLSLRGNSWRHIHPNADLPRPEDTSLAQRVACRPGSAPGTWYLAKTARGQHLMSVSWKMTLRRPLQTRALPPPDNSSCGCPAPYCLQGWHQFQRRCVHPAERSGCQGERVISVCPDEAPGLHPTAQGLPLHAPHALPKKSPPLGAPACFPQPEFPRLRSPVPGNFPAPRLVLQEACPGTQGART